MGSLFAPMHLLVLVLILILFFGRGRVSEILEEFGKGIKSFKKALDDDPSKIEEPLKKTDSKNSKSKNESFEKPEC